MGEPIIVWPPGCGNFMPGDGAACETQGAYNAPCGEYGEGYVQCCPGE